jgi:hypothetical protein
MSVGGIDNLDFLPYPPVWEVPEIEDKEVLESEGVETEQTEVEEENELEKTEILIDSEIDNDLQENFEKKSIKPLSKPSILKISRPKIDSLTNKEYIQKLNNHLWLAKYKFIERPVAVMAH